MSRKTPHFALAFLACSVPAFAGPVTDFEAAYSKMYAGYRSALFTTNSGNADTSAAALDRLQTQWDALVSTYGQTPPPQYEADPQWPETIAEVSSRLARAAEAVGKGNLPERHETLEHVREAFSALHARNGIETFSDRMNAYHAEMEQILALDLATLDAAAKQTVLEHAAVLAYLAHDVLSAPTANAEGDADYATLSGAMQASVDQLLAAARAGDDAAIKAAAGGLKVPYSKFFLKFG